jgi:hypothetical protein
MYAVLNFHWTPSQFLNLNSKEKAFVIACINERLEAEKKQMQEMKRR